MKVALRLSSAAFLMAMAAVTCPAQTVISAHSGTLHYFEGDVSIDGTPVKGQVSKFAEIKEQGILRTGQGRAEVLLTPGVFLRVSENSSIQLLDNRLAATRVDILSGTVSVESDDPMTGVKDSPVTLSFKDFNVHMLHHGLIEINTDPGQMKVFKGSAEVTTADNRATVKEGRMLSFNPALTSEKFDARGTGDDLYIWALQRSSTLSAVNMSSARSVSSGSALTSGAGSGGWYFNPAFDMFTFMPSSGMLWSPFGFGFFSPLTIGSYYAPSGYWYGGGGARGIGSIGQPVASVGTATHFTPPLAQVTGAGNQTFLGSPVRGGFAGVANPSAGFSGGAASGGGTATGFSAPAASGGISAGRSMSGPHR
jgi:hypothetical protein